MYTYSLSFYNTNAITPYLHIDMIVSNRDTTKEQPANQRPRQLLSLSSWYLAVALIARPFRKGLSS